MRVRGFTLVELVTVIVLISVLAVLAVPRLDLGVTDTRAAAGQLIGALRHAQQLSLTHTAAAGYRVEIDAGGYRVRDGAGNDVADPLTGTTPMVTSWSDVTLSPTGSIAFDGRGAPACSGGLSCSAGDTTLTLTTAGGSASVTVERTTGYVR
jgi:MSHA pilin protein MshC